MEDSQTIGTWAESTFGPPKSELHVAIRALKEMVELLDMLSLGEGSNNADLLAKAKVEVADVNIVLHHLAYVMDFDLQSVVDAKMLVNRARKWKLDGAGCGQHE